MATIHLTGNLANNPVTRYRSEQTMMAEFRLAVNHRYPDRNGNWVDGEPTFVTVQCWGKLAQNLMADGMKGMPVLVIGRLYQSTWTAEGSSEKRSALRIRASHVGPDMTLRRVRILKEQEQERVEDEQEANNSELNKATGETEGFGNADAAEEPEAQREGELVGAGAASPPF